MRKFYYIMSLIAVITIVSCKKKEEVVPLPTVDFSYNPVNPIAPSTVTFTNNCQNATSFSWNFGNGQTSTLPNPSVNYTTGGTFTVILTATGAGGTNGATKTINVTGSPVADFTVNATGIRAPAVITFTNTSQNGVAYFWDFGNGQTSTLQNPTPTFATGGTFSVTLVVTGQGGLTSRVNKSVTVLPAFTKVGISALTILAYPATKTNSDNWDSAASGTFPDVYFAGTVSGTTTVLYSLPVASRLENLRVSDLPKGWSSTTGGSFYTHTNLDQKIDFDLYDFESVGTDEYIGTATFNFREYVTVNNPYPTTATITNGTVTIKLTLIWQ
jgi:PKD repeat protein